MSSKKTTKSTKNDQKTAITAAKIARCEGCVTQLVQSIIGTQHIIGTLFKHFKNQ